MSPQLDFSSRNGGSQFCSPLDEKLLLDRTIAASTLPLAPRASIIAHKNCHSTGSLLHRNSSACLNYATSLRRNVCVSNYALAEAKMRGQPIKAQVVNHKPTARENPSLEKLEYDVVIVGAGIIGLSIAHRLLSTTDLSVAVVDASRPCAGATGAGQGYIWLGHKEPRTTTWPLAKRSKQLWEEFAKGLQALGLDPATTIGYKKTGSLLFGSTSEQSVALQNKVKELCNEGVQADYLNASAVTKVEPQLKVGAEGSAALIHDDSQIDAQLATSYIAGENRNFCSSGRFKEIYYDPVESFLWSDQGGQISGVQTRTRIIYCKERLIMAAGAWSGGLMESVFKRFSPPLVLPTKPRKGHLLVFKGLSQVSLRHALMEFEYAKIAESEDVYGIATTATVDAQGQLLLGSSRQFTGFDYSLQYDVMESILKRASKFLPALGNTHLAEALKGGTVRIGHRPYVPDGRPMIGKVPGLEGLLLATGHEGEGLCLALGTAEMVVNLISDNGKHVVDPSPFSPAGRLVPPKPGEPIVHRR